MKLNNVSLPYPVLGINDDVFPLLNDDCLVVDVSNSDTSEYVFEITLKQENEDITKLIENGFAEYVCEVDCSRTFFKKCYTANVPRFVITIPRERVAREIEFTCFVLAKEKIYNYENSRFNIDYKGYTFDLEQGDLLVVFPPFLYSVDIKYDKLQVAGSFMQIREGVNLDVTFFDISGDKIEILLPTPLYNIYRDVLANDNDFIEIIHSSIVFNALVYALYNIKENESTTWARTIKYRIVQEKMLNEFDLEDITKIPELAQALLGDPYKRLFNKLQIFKQQDIEDE